MEKETKEEKQAPGWLGGRGGINEVAFSRYFYEKYSIIYQDGAFFSPEGRITNENTLRCAIYEEISPYVTTAIAAKVDRIVQALRMEAAQTCLRENPEEDTLTIPVANGTFYLQRPFSPMKHLCRYRLPVNYNPDAPVPEKWLQFLSELLHEEDIPTLQEYMGYCLIPCTLGQKMLIITGKGGEGKSRIGVVMKALLGSNMNLGSIAKVEKSPFARADLQHILLMVDDDLKMEAMDQTNYLKSIITAELAMDLEKKGIQSYQGKLNVRFLAFGNSSLQALHDRSHGFFRRQIILEAKERSPKRKDDPYLAYTLVKEKEGILLWCIEGLKRLHLNEFRFTQSRRARENLLRSMVQANNVVEFLRSEGYIRFDPQGRATSKVLYECYQSWCTDNALRPLSAHSFWGYLQQNVQTYNLTFTRAIPIGNDKYARGYQGIRVINRM